MVVPSVHQWQRYDQATRWRLRDDGRTASLFWVALRLFLTEGMALPEAEQAQSFLGRWITQGSEAIEDASVRDIATYVAAMSSFRLVLRLQGGGLVGEPLPLVLAASPVRVGREIDDEEPAGLAVGEAVVVDSRRAAPPQ